MSLLRRLTEQKTKFSHKDFYSKCEQIRIKLRICSHHGSMFRFKIEILKEA